MRNKDTQDLNEPLFLAIDASENSCSIALGTAHTVLTSVCTTETKTQAAWLLPSIKNILEQNKLAFSDLSALVLSNGPGRFTGLRITHSLVQGLAYCHDKKIILLNSLNIYAQQYAARHLVESSSSESLSAFIEPTDIIWVCIKAYNNFYYQAKYGVDNGICYLLSEIKPETKRDTRDKADLELNKSEDARFIKTKQEIINELINESDSHRFRLIGSGWSDFADLDYNPQGLINSKDYCRKLNIINQAIHNIYNLSLNVEHSLVLAGIEFNNKVLYNPHQILTCYAVNPYA